MNRYENLIKKRNDALASAEAILATVAKDNDREFTAEEQSQFDGFKAEAAKLNRAIEREQEVSALDVGKRTAQPAPETAAVDRGFSPRVEVDKPEILKDRKFGFSSIGEQAIAIMSATLNPSATDRRLQILAAATGMSQGVGSDGGYLVAPEFSSTIYEGVVGASDSLLGMTDNYTVTGESLTFNANAETSRAAGSRWGGVQSYWISEASQITSSKPTFRQVKLEPQQLAVLVYATDKLLRNAPTSVEQYVSRAAIDEINFKVGDALVNGTGAGQPLGVLNAPCLVSVSKETGQAATSLVTANINKMYTRRLGKNTGRYAWFINQDVEPQLEVLSVDVGTGGVPVYLPAGGIADAPNARLKGRPVYPIEYCATLGTVGDIILADMKGLAVGIQGTVETAMSMHLRFDYAETAFRFMFAIDAEPWIASAITPFKGSNTQSCFVALATRS